jgi:hypothetical protein
MGCVMVMRFIAEYDDGSKNPSMFTTPIRGPGITLRGS